MKRLTNEEYKEVVLGVLLQIDEICRTNDLTYMLCYGTLLGAVRHQGFIPWDDDVDIIMPRKDYDVLRQLITDGDYGLNFISIETHRDTIYPYGKVCATDTTLYEKHFRPVKGYGAFVDVFPMDYLPKDPKKRARLRRRYTWARKLITHSGRQSIEWTTSWWTNLLRCGAFIVGKCVSTEWMIRKTNAHSKRLNDEYTGIQGVVWDMDFPAECMQNTTELLFEGHSLRVPQNPELLLERIYGDYMTPPPIEQQIQKHSLECYLHNN